MQVIPNAEVGGWIPNPDTIIPETGNISNLTTGLDNVENPELDENGNEIKKEEETPNVELEINKLPETITELFEELRVDKVNNFGFYEDRKVETKEDVAQFININVDAKLETAYKNLDDTWYKSKSPVFQEFAQMAEMAGGDISKLYSIIDSQRTIDDFTEFDTTDPLQAELIVENWLKLKNEPPDIIQEEINDLKTREIINDRAEKYKPLLIAHFEKEKQNKLIQEQQSISLFYKAVDENEKNVMTHLSAKDLDGMRWRQADKDIIYEALSYNPELQGFNIYKKIEDLQAAGEFDKLSKIALLAENPERFDELYVSRVKTTVVKGLRDKIRFANDTVDTPEDKPQKNTKVNIVEDEFKPYVFS